MKLKNTCRWLLKAVVVLVMLPAATLQAANDAVIPPFEEDWTDPEAFGRYTVVDANGDGRTWGVNNDGLARYTYSTRNDADDWLLSPDLFLEPGRVYLLTLTALAGKSYSERMEVRLGEGDAPSNYTTVLVEPTDIPGGDTVELLASFSVKEQKVFKVGFHAISDKNHFYLTLKGWKLGVMVESGAPAEVGMLNVTPGPKGALTAVVAFTAPSTTMGGDKLESIDKIDVKIDGKTIDTILHPIPGDEQRVEVAVESDGYHVFEAVAANAVGEGFAAVAKTYIGSDAPVMQGSLTCQDMRGGRTACSWAAVTAEVGANGGYVDPQAVEYRVYVLDRKGQRDEMVASTQQTRCEFDYSFWDWGYAETLDVEVEPCFAGRAGEPMRGWLIIGNSATIPYHYSFANADGDGFWWEKTTGARWHAATTAADDDRASSILVPTADHATARAGTQKISLKGAGRPMLLFHYLMGKGGGARARVMVSRQDAEGPVCLETLAADAVSDGLWVFKAIDLSAFADDDYVVVSFEVETERVEASFCLDDICVRDVPDCDVQLTALAMPKTVKVGEETTVTATVQNNGLHAVTDGQCAVAFTVNGKEMGVVPVEGIVASFKGTTACSLNFVPTIFFGSMMEVKAKVVCRGDETPANDEAAMSATVRLPSVARPTNLTAQATGADVQLKWDMPEDPSDFGNVITEEFEDMAVYPPMSTGGVTADNHEGGLGQWKLRDGNGGPTCTPEGCDTCKNMGGAMAFMVFNAHHAGLDMTDHAVVEAMAAYSGEQALLTMAPLSGEASDKWLISPPLSGLEQTISFFVSATGQNEGEATFEVWYSTTDDELEHFQKTYEGVATVTDWREERLDLPGGVTYFAIRSTAKGKAGLMVDDITFTAYPSVARMPAAKVEVTAYHVYRDEELVATLKPGTMEHTDVGVDDGAHRYHVTAMYGNTESALSNPADILVDATSLPSIFAGSLSNGDVVVYSADGVMLGRGEAVLRRLPAGLYIVKNRRTGHAGTVWRK